MRPPATSSGGSSSGTIAGLASPALIVILVLLLGATIFLWRARYMRRKTAYIAMGVLVVLIVVSCYLNYQGGQASSL